MILGCAWYPEHWTEARWAEDFRLMRQAGMNMVRVGEFAWSRLEPREGQFDLDWLERAIALASEYGISAVVGTPTAAPPAWLTQAYPEVLAVREDGRRARHGARCHFSPTSTLYRKFCQAIAGQMARRFGMNPNVIGWQIDNEYGSVSYDDDTQRQFQEWLRQRFGTLDALNAHWTAAYWSQEYTDWAQIPLPLGGHNPGLMLAFRLFITDVYCDYQRVQLDAIRQYASSEQWITTNLMGWFDQYDSYAICKDLDIAAWDSYLSGSHLQFTSSGAGHDLTRGFKMKNYLLLETQPGSLDWLGANSAPDRGEVRAIAWHAVGHGADCVSYWQWRSALNGQEQYFGTLVAPDGNPRPAYEEVAQLGEDFQKAGALLDGTSISSSIAILHNYESRWAINFHRHHHDFDPVQHLLSFYKPLRTIGYNVDIVHPLAPFPDYRVVIAPHLHLLDDAIVAHLAEYVQGGGHLVLGPRSGMKDMHNSLLPMRQPGPLAEMLGAHVEEYYALDVPIPVKASWGVGEARTWAEWLLVDAPDAEVMLNYGPANGWLDNQPAMVTRRVGLGRITYLGAWLDDALMQRFTGWLEHVSQLETPFGTLPEDVEICRRQGAGKDVYIVINHAVRPCQLGLPHPMRDALTGSLHRNWIVLTPHQPAVLTAANG